MTLVCTGKETCLSTGGQMSYLGSYLFPPNFLLNLPVLNKTHCVAKQQKQNLLWAVVGPQEILSVYDPEMASLDKNSTDPQSQEG